MFHKKIRVIYKPDGQVAIIHPAYSSIRKNETEDEFYKRVYKKTMLSVPKLQGLEFDDLDASSLPDAKVSPPEKWRGKKGKGVFVDPTVKTWEEKMATLNSNIDSELEKPEPDAIKLIKMQREKEKLLTPQNGN